MLKILAAFIVMTACNIGMAEATNVKTSGGRFQLIQLSNMARDQYLLDTQTGKVWQRACLYSGKNAGPGDCAVTAWMVDDVEGITISLDGLTKRIKNAKENEQ